MSVVISSSFVLGTIVSGGDIITDDNPLIGYNNLANSGNLSTTTANTSFPAVNLTNPATYLRWSGTSLVADEYITMALATAELVDYVGIARHNLGSAQITVSLEVFNGSIWVEVISPFIPATDAPILMRFEPQGVLSIRIRLQPGLEVPTIAVVYAGTLLILQRRIYVGHVPLAYSQATKISNGRSESGNFLGRIVINRQSKTTVEIQNLTPDWYRSYMAPFIAASQDTPFFFAWRPGSYPNEVGYAWMLNDPHMLNQRSNGMVKTTLELGGIYP